MRLETSRPSEAAHNLGDASLLHDNEILNWYFVLSIDKYNIANVMWNWQWFEILGIFVISIVRYQTKTMSRGSSPSIES